MHSRILDIVQSLFGRPKLATANCNEFQNETSFKRKRKLFLSDLSSFFPNKMARKSDNSIDSFRRSRRQVRQTELIELSDDEQDLFEVPIKINDSYESKRPPEPPSIISNEEKIIKCLDKLKPVTNYTSRSVVIDVKKPTNNLFGSGTKCLSYLNKNLDSQKYLRLIDEYTQKVFQKPKLNLFDSTEKYNLRLKKSIPCIDLTVDENNIIDDDIVVIDEKQNEINKHLNQSRIWITKSKRANQEKHDEISRIAQEHKQEIRQRHEHNQRIIENDLENDLNRFLSISKKSYVEDDLQLEDVVEVAVLPQISLNDRNLFFNHLRNANDNEVIIKKYNESVRRYDLKTLESHGWLNDEIINFYLVLIQKRNEAKGLKSVHAMNTFFLSRYQTHFYSGVRRWTKNVDIFSKDFIIVPVHLGYHWCMITINVNKKQCFFYDSMLIKRPEYVNLIRKYLIEEHENKKNKPLDVDDWTFDQKFDIPAQQNSWDCGVFSCTFAEFVTRDISLNKNIFSESDMEFFRIKMGVEIIKGEIMT